MTDQRKRKLIEVALPLEEINAACKADKDRKTGTLRNLHKWFAPMPLPAWRALLFAALIDDPGEELERQQLLDLIRELVSSGADAPKAPTVQRARKLLERQFPEGLPSVLDPFCGGGSTLVEAQRLGMFSVGSDLNPVPALISRTLTEILPAVKSERGVAPIAPDSELTLTVRQSALRGSTRVPYANLIEDVSRYAEIVREEVAAHIGHLYPTLDGEIIHSYLWVRTVRCSDPACRKEAPLATQWWLVKKPKERVWIQPIYEDGRLRLTVESRTHGDPPPPSKQARGANFACVACDSTLTEAYVISEALSGGLGMRLAAVVAERHGRRVYRAPTEGDEEGALSAESAADFGVLALPDIPRWFSGPRFGLTRQRDLYTERQLVVNGAFADAVAQLPRRIREDGGSTAWAVAITVLLGLAVGKLAHVNSTQARWKLDSRSGSGSLQAAFGRADIPMTWDFGEVAPLSDAAGSWRQCVRTLLDAVPLAPQGEGRVVLADARAAKLDVPGLVATDPPYFDAIGYADLSDYFYIWHRRALRDVVPDLYRTVAAPKLGELTAVPAHHGGPAEARKYFTEGFTEAFRNLRRSLADGLPMLVVYASKEHKGSDEETSWESILSAMVAAELEITGTWPIHGTGSSRLIGQGTNSVATYVAMIARPRDPSAVAVSLGDFSRALRRELGSAIRALQVASVLPVDMGQAVLGPGMSIFSRHAMVTDQRGERVSVAQAIRLINTVAQELQEEQEGELDQASQFALTLWSLNGWEVNSFDTANRIARPKGISVDEVVRAGVATSRANKVSLLGRFNLDRGWRPGADSFPTAWEAVHHLIDRLIDGGGETAAGELLHTIQEVGIADPARLLTYRLATVAAKTSRTKDEERYNALIDAWPRLHASSASTSERLF